MSKAETDKDHGKFKHNKHHTPKTKRTNVINDSKLNTAFDYLM